MHKADILRTVAIVTHSCGLNREASNGLALRLLDVENDRRLVAVENRLKVERREFLKEIESDDFRWDDVDGKHRFNVRSA